MRRLRKALSVRLHWQGHEQAATTIDLSAGGMLLSARSIIAPGTHVFGTLVIPNGPEMTFEAQVRWAQQADKRVPALAASLNRMGLRFDSAPAEAYYQLLSFLWKRSSSRARAESIEASGALR